MTARGKMAESVKLGISGLARDHFGGDLLVDIMKTHPKVVMGCTVLENLYYVPPEEFAGTGR